MIGKFTGIYMKIVNQKNDCSVEREEYLWRLWGGQEHGTVDSLGGWIGCAIWKVGNRNERWNWGLERDKGHIIWGLEKSWQVTWQRLCTAIFGVVQCKGMKLMAGTSSH
jgi:hypothetical protein